MTRKKPAEQSRTKDEKKIEQNRRDLAERLKRMTWVVTKKSA